MIGVLRWLAIGMAALTTTASVHHAGVRPDPVSTRGDGSRQVLVRTDFLGPRDVSRAELAAAAPTPAVAVEVAAKRVRPVVVQASRPAPAAAPAAGSCDAGCVQNLIRQAFAPYGQTGVDWGLRVAGCESGYNANAYNPAGPYYGVFQFLMSTFKATPYGNQSIYDASANVNAAAWKYGQGGAGAWGCK